MKSTRVPKALEETYAAVTTLTDDLCREHLSEEYGELARLAAAALSRKRPSPMVRGRPKTWACGVLYALGQVNFLSDRSHEPSMPLGELCDLMGVGQSTASAKARVVSRALDLHQFQTDWTLPSLLEQHPFAWYVEFEGMIVDARSLPRQVQEAAFERGLIPYVPGAEDRQILIERYPQLRRISTVHQTRLAERSVEGTAADIAVRIGLLGCDEASYPHGHPHRLQGPRTPLRAGRARHLPQPRDRLLRAAGGCGV